MADNNDHVALQLEDDVVAVNIFTRARNGIADVCTGVTAIYHSAANRVRRLFPCFFRRFAYYAKFISATRAYAAVIAVPISFFLNFKGFSRGNLEGPEMMILSTSCFLLHVAISYIYWKRITSLKSSMLISVTRGLEGVRERLTRNRGLWWNAAIGAGARSPTVTRKSYRARLASAVDSTFISKSLELRVFLLINIGMVLFIYFLGRWRFLNKEP